MLYMMNVDECQIYQKEKDRFKTDDPAPEQKLSYPTDKVMKEPLSGDGTDGWHYPYLSNQKALKRNCSSYLSNQKAKLSRQ